MRMATKAKENLYYKARMRAAKDNPRLANRESAAEVLGLHPSTLADYELDMLKMPNPDKALLMAETYHAPELVNYFCSGHCTLGVHYVQRLEIRELDRLAIQTLSALQNTEVIKAQLLDITADGVIDEEEEDQLTDILEKLNEISITAKELRMWAILNLFKEEYHGKY